MGASEQDLKAQLSDIQKRFTEATFNSPKRSSQAKNDTLVGSKPNQSSQLSSSSVQKSDKKSITNFLTKREKRVSLPVLESSKSPSVKNSGKDMDFVVGLSENLLTECRRLQAENQQKATQLRTFEEELSKLKQNNSILSNKLNETIQNEEKSKDLNWELETKLQQLTQEFKNTNENYTKTQKELNKQVDLSNEIRTELEEAHVHKHTLQQEFSSNKISVSQEIQTLTAHVDELNEVNSRLNDELDELRSKIEESNKKPKETIFTSIPILKPQEDSDSDEEYNEPGVSPVKIIPSDISSLETDELRSSLSNAHQTIAKLRQQILKLRSNELKSKSPDVKLPPLNTAPLKKSAKALNENRSFAILGNSNRSSTYIVSESEADDWENFEGDSTLSNIDSPTRVNRPLRPLSTVSGTSNELIDDSESDAEDIHHLPVALSSEVQTISIEDVEKYAEEHHLVVLPMEQFKSMKTVQPESPFKNFKEADIVSKAKERGFSIFSQQEWATQKQELDSKILEVKSLNDRIAVISEAEKKYAKEAADYRSKLDDTLLKVTAEEEKIKELELQLSNPSEKSIRDVATRQNLQVLSLDEFEDLQSEITSLQYKLNNPSTDFVTAKAGLLGLTVLKAEGHSSLLSEIEALRASHSKSEDAKKNLENQLSSLSESAKQIELEKDDLSSKLESLKSSSTQIYNAKLELEKSVKSNLETAEQEKEEFLNFKNQVEEEKKQLQEKLDSLSTDLDAHVSTKEELESKLSWLNEEVEQHKTSKEELHSKFSEISQVHEKAIQEHSAAIETLNIESDKKLQELHESSTSKLAALTGEIATLKAAEALHSESLKKEVFSREQLQKSIDEPSSDYIKEKASIIGLRAVEVATYEKELTDLQSSITLLEQNLESKKIESAEKDKETSELIDELKKQIDEPSSDYIKEKAGFVGHIALPVSDYENNLLELNNNIKVLEEELNSSKNREISVTEEIEKLKTQINEPSPDYLEEKAKSKDLHLIPLFDFNSLVNNNKETVQELNNNVKVLEGEIDQLKQKEKSNGETIEQFRSQIDEPSADYLKEKATSADFKLIPVSEFEQIVTEHETKVSDLSTKIKQVEEDLLLTTKKEGDATELVEKLKSEIENPSVDYLKTKSEAVQYKLLPTDEFTQILEKSQKTVDELAAEKDSVVLTKERVDELINPSKEVISSKAETYGLVALPLAVHERLLSESNSPSLEHITEKADTLGYTVLSKTEYADIIKKTSSPSKDFIAKGAAALGLIAVSQTAFDSSKKEIFDLKKELAEKSLIPTASADDVIVKQVDYDNLFAKSNLTIDDLAKEQNKVVLDKDAHELLLNPSADTVTSHADKHNLTVVPREEYQSLIREKDHPSIETLKDKAALHDQVIVSSSHYQTLKSEIEKPSAEYLKEKATLAGLTTLHNDEYTELKTKANKSIEELSQEQGKILLTEREHEELKNPDNHTVTKLAAAVGLSTLASEELQNLKKSIESPDLQYLEEKAKSHSHAIVPLDHYESLNKAIESPELDYLKDKAKLKSLVIIPQSEHDILKETEKSPSIEFLTSKAKDQNHSLVPEAELEDLHHRVSKSLDELANENGKVVLSQTDYDALKTIEESPSEEFLTSKAAALGFGILAASKLSELNTKANKSIKEIAAENKQVVLTEDEFESLKSFENSPSVEFLRTKAKESDLSLIPETELAELKALASKPITETASENNQVVVSKEEFESLKSSNESPTAEFLSSKASNIGLSLIASDQLSELKSHAEKSIDELANEKDQVVLSRSDFESLKSIEESPSNEFLTSKAAIIGLSVVAADELSQLKTQANRSISEVASENGQVVLSQKEFDSLKSASESPSKEVLIASAAGLGLSVIPTDEFGKLQHQVSRSISDVAAENGQIVLSQKEFDSLKSASESPSKEVLIASAAGLGLSVIPTDEFGKLQHQANRSISDVAAENGQIVLSQKEFDSLKSASESPSKEVLIASAAGLGLSVIPSDEFGKLQHQVSRSISDVAADNGQVVLTNDEYKALKSPSKSAILASVGALGLVTLGAAEHAKLTKPSKVDLEKFAASENLVLVPKNSYDDVVKRSSKSIDEIAKESNMKVLSETELLQLTTPSADRLKDLAAAAGLVTVSQDVFDKFSKPSDSDIVKLAEGNGLAAIPATDYVLLKERADNPDYELAKQKGYVLKDEISYVEVEELANRFHSKLVDLNEDSVSVNRPFTANENRSVTTFASTINESEFTDALSRVDSNTSTIGGDTRSNVQEVDIEQLRASASHLGFSLVPNTTENNRDSVIDGDYSGFDTLGRDETFDEKDHILKRAQDLGLVVLEEDAYEELSTRNLDRETLTSKAHELGLKVIDADEAQKLENPEEDQIRAASGKLGLVVLSNIELNELTQKAVESVKPEQFITDENIKSLADEKDLKVLTNKEYAELKKSPSSWDLAALTLGASALGLAVVNKSTVENSSVNLKTVSKDDILSKASDFGLVAVAADEYNSLKAIQGKAIPQLTKEDIVSKASQFGLVAVDEKDYTQSQQAAAPVVLSREEISSQATHLGLVVVDKNEYNDLSAQLANSHNIKTKSFLSEDTQEESNEETEDEGTTLPLTRDEIEENARNLGLLAIPENAFIATNVSRTPDVNNVVVLPITYYNKLTKSEAFNLDKVTNEELQEQISKRGLQLTSMDVGIDSASHLTRKSTITSLSTSTSRKNLADAAESAAAYEFDHPTTHSSRSHSRVPSISNSRAGSVKPISRDLSVDGGLSLMTNASLTESRIIPALTQTVIGEYLHKYYRRLGPLSSISETRHERFFWIHPYTLTLYWSTTNPVLGNPASHKTRAAAIVGVESVDDNNPLPAGLHHKSIIVHSQTRSIKFTCPTRQRHNIWYNSLRYLIQRSMDGIELDEDFDHLLDNKI